MEIHADDGGGGNDGDTNNSDGYGDSDNNGDDDDDDNVTISAPNILPDVQLAKTVGKYYVPSQVCLLI